jgi:hypothetical protein
MTVITVAEIRGLALCLLSDPHAIYHSIDVVGEV